MTSGFGMPESDSQIEDHLILFQEAILLSKEEKEDRMLSGAAVQLIGTIAFRYPSAFFKLDDVTVPLVTQRLRREIHGTPQHTCQQLLLSVFRCLLTNVFPNNRDPRVIDMIRKTWKRLGEALTV